MGVSTSVSLGGTVTGTIVGMMPVIVNVTLQDVESAGATPLMLADDMLPQTSFQPDTALITFSLVAGADNVSVQLMPITVVPEPSTLVCLFRGDQATPEDYVRFMNAARGEHGFRRVGQVSQPASAPTNENLVRALAD